MHNIKLTYAIIEDEESCIRQLRNILTQLPVNYIGSAKSVESAVTLIDKLHPDLVFLDVEIKGGSGFDVIQKTVYNGCKYIFTTAHEGYAIKAIRFSALDYLLKPFSEEEVEQAFNNAQRVLDYQNRQKLLLENLEVSNSLNKKITLSESECVHYIPVKDIVYCKADKSYTTFHFKSDPPITVSDHLKKYEDIFTDYGFIRVHNSYLISANHIKMFQRSNGGYVIMSNSDEVPVSRRRKDSLLVKFRN